MCGRYSLATPLDELVEVFDVDEVAIERWAARYNLAPTDDAPVIIRGAEGERRLGLMRWGLVPFWADDPSLGNKLINARSESAERKPAFREAFARRRCLVPADGFYEWRKLEPEGGGKPWKQPYWIHRCDGRPMAFAGLWERWRPEKGADPLITFTLLTTRASRWMAPLHDRMPVVLPDREAEEAWLDPEAGADDLKARLEPAPDDLLEARAVSTAVNRPQNEGPELLEEVEAPPVRSA